MSSDQTRTYRRDTSVVFLKTKEAFGGLSNMAGGYPLRVNGIRIRTSEALYQACRFPHLPDVQRLIIGMKSPMTAKMKSKPHRQNSRPDWEQVRVNIMRWCLRVKLAQNWSAFSELLLETEDRPIVEQSRKDDFWGAKPIDEHTLVGMNVLGRLLMELREVVKTEDHEALLRVQPLTIPDFMIYREPIGIVNAEEDMPDVSMDQTASKAPHAVVDSPAALQPSLFAEPAANEIMPTAHLDVSRRDLLIANLKPYPTYRVSGIKWLGEIPTHWKTERAKWLFRKMERPAKDTDDVVTCFRDGVVTLRKNRRIRGFTESLKEIGYQGILRGDLVIHTMDAFAGAAGVSDSDGKGTSVYSVCAPIGKRANPYYYAFCVREMARSEWILALAKGIRERSTDFRFVVFAAQAVPAPSLSEQTAIVRFLDHADKRIRRFIRAKRKQIALLEEEKQAIIHQAVTGRIDVRTGQPYPAYKSSGVEWLGEVPEHWGVRRLRNLVDMRVSNVDKHVKEDENPVRLCNYVDVYKNDYINEQMDFMQATATDEEIERFRLEKDDVLITKDSEAWDDIGVPALVAEPAYDLISGYHLALLRPRADEIVGGYLLRALQSKGLAYQFYIEAKGVTRYGLSHSGIKSVWLPVPSPTEQSSIVDYLDRSTIDINATVDHTHRQIELLREYRTRLIADVVTGKLDVREAAAALPEVDPLEAEDVPDDAIDADAEEAAHELDAVLEEAEA